MFATYTYWLTAHTNMAMCIIHTAEFPADIGRSVNHAPLAPHLLERRTEIPAGLLERHPIMLDHMRRSLRRRDSVGIRLT